MSQGGSLGGRGGLEQTADLWLKIDQLHLNYLKSEDGPKKLDIRRKLEGGGARKRKPPIRTGFEMP